MKKYGKSNLKITNLEEVQNYHFPGNIRELEHSVEREIILSENENIKLSLSYCFRRTNYFKFRRNGRKND
jgi:transcriptional regulator with GAF, ATPase, and Fis domain